MNKQTFQIACMMLDPRITAKPLHSLARLRANGVRRIPDPVYDDLKGRGRRGHALKFVRRWLDGEMFTRHNGQWVLNSFMPPFPGPAYERMFDNLFSGRHLSPVSAFIAVTSKCPCRCSHCSAQRNLESELTTGQWLDTLRQLQELGTSLVGFTGGEPLERTDLPELVSEAKRLGMNTILFTSGAGFTKEKMNILNTAGLWACCVSLDFDNAEEHDRMRGRKGTFGEALETVRYSKNAGFYTLISSVATRSFIDSKMYERVYALGRKLGIHEYRIVEPMPCGELAGADENTLLNPERIRTLRDFHIRTNRGQKPPKVCAFNQIESPEIFGCGAGTQHLYIQPDGTVCPCDFTPLGFGSVKNTPLATIWKKMNLAMGDNPRCDCFIQKHHALVNEHAAEGFPLSEKTSEQICRTAGSEPLPGYFAMVCGQNEQKEPV
ncbi:MAG: radical SAM protein [Pontiellaceae bacterium]|nr:radical SAM protein [Pontiellaceae bacterium]MBN2783503.1 radical SAM protein [Pontiellaceae bacterium]